MRSCIVLLAAVLAGCATQLEIPKEVPIPVPVACVDRKDLPVPPQIHNEAELLLLDEYDRTLTLWIDYARLQAHRLKLEVIAKRCSEIPAIRPTHGLGIRPP